jgi:mono/diheme cytochrome c family protein
MPSRVIRGFAWSALCILAALCGPAHAVFAADVEPVVPHFADADNAALVTEGQQIYGQACAACHGRRLQGQALWQLKDQFAGRRAPAHDSTGHTWQHADEDLFHMTKFGRFAATPPDAVSYMPAFEGRLSDHEILAVLAFIKSTWPMGLRATQAMLNPGLAGMPANAGKLHWTLPPNCIESIQVWQEGSK